MVITMFFFQKKLFFFLIFASICSITQSTPVNQQNNTQTTTNIVDKNSQEYNSLTTTYNELLQDVRWFFQRLEDFSSTAEQILPNVSLNEQTRTFSESTRLNFLVGLRHLLTGIREISYTFRKSLETEHMRQLQYVIQATNTLHEAFKTVKVWFSNLRSLAAQIFRIYNRHIPEVLLGKCLGRYVISVYPDRMFYEYPFLLMSDIFNTIFKSVNNTSNVEISSQTGDEFDQSTTTEVVSIEQNEIPHHEEDDYKMQMKGRALDDSISNNEDYLMSFLNFSDVLEQDKEMIIESAVEKHSWQKCFKMYTAETIVRKLKVYFLEME